MTTRKTWCAILTAALHILTISTLARPTETFNQEYAFRVEGELNTAIPMRGLLVDINQRVDRYLGKPENPNRLPTLTVHTSSETPSPSTSPLSTQPSTRPAWYSIQNHGFQIWTPPDAAFTQTVARLSHLALLQRMKISVSESRLEASEPPAWMVAAVAAPLIAPYQPTTDPPQLSPRNLAPVQAKFNAAKPPPELKHIIDTPVDAIFPNGYTLYSLHAYVVAELILQLEPAAPQKTIERLFELHVQGRPAINSLRLVIEPLLPPGTDIQQWYVNAAENYLTSKTERTTGGQVADEIAFLLTVDVNELPADTVENVTSRIPIVMIPNNSPFWSSEKPFLTRRLNQFIKLLTRSPKSFREPVKRYMEAFQELLIGGGDIPKFKSRINQTDSEFAATFMRHRRIYDYLAAYELQMGAGVRGLDRFMAVVTNHNLRVNSLAPQLTRYLDKIESEIQ